MTKEKSDAVTSEVTNVVKKVRRGIAAARGTTRLKFSHEQAKVNGLFIAHLDSVSTSTIKIGEDKTGIPSFNGLEIPKLVLTFASNEADVAKRHYVTLQFTAVESNANTIPGGKEEWKVNSVFDWLKHILNVYVLNGRELTDEESEALSLSFEDFDEEGEYVPVEAEDVIASWKTVFENFENIMNRGRDGQPYYKNKDGKDISVWLKLLRYFKTKKGWTPISNGDLSFPSFVGEGCIEIYKQNTAPAIRIDSVKEAIVPMNIEKPKAPNMPAMSAGIGGGASSMAGGVPVDPMAGMGNFGGISIEAAEDMPF